MIIFIYHWGAMTTWLIKIHTILHDWVVFENTKDCQEVWVLNQKEYRRVLPNGSGIYLRELGFVEEYHPQHINLKEHYPEEFL
jgi:hypothetical protein